MVLIHVMVLACVMVLAPVLVLARIMVLVRVMVLAWGRRFGPPAKSRGPNWPFRHLVSHNVAVSVYQSSCDQIAH